MIRFFIRTSLVVAAIALATLEPAAAHGDKMHESHGGKMVASGHHKLEVIATDGAIEIHVMGEDGAPEDASKAKATAAILSGGKKIDVVLAPVTGNVLRGEGAFKAEPGTVIVITLTMPEHAPEQSRLQLD